MYMTWFHLMGDVMTVSLSILTAILAWQLFDMNK